MSDPLDDDLTGMDGRRRRADRGAPGRRSAARRRRRRQAAGQTAVILFAVVAFALAGVWVATNVDLGGGSGSEPTDGPSSPFAVGDDVQPTLVLATFDEQQREDGASQIIILAHDHEEDRGLVLLVPATTVAEIPGHGLLQLGRAFGFGEGPLLKVTLDNLLGVDLDAVAGVSRQGWASFFTRIGGLTIDVPRQLAAVSDSGQREIRFQPGEQFLDGPRLAEYLTITEPGEPELQRFPRVQDVLEALLVAVTADETTLDTVFEDGAPMLDVVDAAAVRALLELLAADHAAGTLQVRTLPVTPIGTGDESSYRLDATHAEPLIAEQLGGSVTQSGSREGRNLQVLNGNGIPGIGQQVAERLTPAGFRIVLTRNADRFDYETTKIIVYSDSAEQLALAEQIRQLLGVGEIERSAIPLDVADMTVVVGADFSG